MLVRNGLLAASAAMMLVTLYMVFLWVPTELNLGVSQRIYYFHVPISMLSMVAIFVVAIASIAHLVKDSDLWDSLAYSAAEIGFLFSSLSLVTGVIWAKGDLGWWWTWDLKLTTTLVLWFIFVGYLMVRAYAPKGSQGARFASVVALLGAAVTPFIYLASILTETAHPELNVGPLASSDDAIASDNIRLTFRVALLAFTIFYIHLLTERFHLRRAESALDRLHQEFAARL